MTVPTTTLSSPTGIHLSFSESPRLVLFFQVGEGRTWSLNDRSSGQGTLVGSRVYKSSTEEVRYRGAGRDKTILPNRTSRPRCRDPSRCLESGSWVSDLPEVTPGRSIGLHPLVEESGYETRRSPSYARGGNGGRCEARRVETTTTGGVVPLVYGGSRYVTILVFPILIVRVWGLGGMGR